jgi:hypothetical protein
MAVASTDLNARENLLTAARMTHNQEIIDVAEVLNETNDMIADAPVMRANDITSHVISRRTALPGSEWVKVGNGWEATSGTLNQVRETMGQLKARYQCPDDVMRIQPNQAKYRMQQERPHIEGMGQELSNTLVGVYSAGAVTPTAPPPEEFAGLQYRYNTLSTADSAYVISNGNTAGGTVDNTSIWFVQWGDGRVYLTHPRNTQGGGLRKEDKGLVYTPGDNASTSVSSNNKMLWAWITEFAWDIGLVVEDTRSVKRLCNIDSALGATNSLNVDNVIRIKNNFKSRDMVFMYVNEEVFTQLDILAKDKVNVHWSENNPFGKPQLFFRDMPVRREDAIGIAEGVIS